MSFLTLITILWVVQNSCYVAAEFCAEDLTEEEEIGFICSCYFKNEVCKQHSIYVHCSSYKDVWYIKETQDDLQIDIQVK